MMMEMVGQRAVSTSLCNDCPMQLQAIGISYLSAATIDVGGKAEIIDMADANTSLKIRLCDRSNGRAVSEGFLRWEKNPQETTARSRL